MTLPDTDASLAFLELLWSIAEQQRVQEERQNQGGPDDLTVEPAA